MNADSSQRNLSGKIYDPVFLCMIGAIILAVGSSVALRAMVAGSGPGAARASDMEYQAEQPAPAHMPKSQSR